MTSHAGGVSTPLALEHPAFEKLQDEEGHFGLAGVAEEVIKYSAHQVPRHGITDKAMEKTEGSTTEIPSDEPLCSGIDTSSSIESGSTVTVESDSSEPSIDSSSVLNAIGSSAKPDSTTEINPAVPSIPSTASEPPGSERGRDHILTSSERVRKALLRAEQRSSSLCEDRVGRVWIRRKDFLRDQEDETRNPLRRSSSLPNPLLSHTRVVSSLRIQLGGGAVRHCTPPAYSYKYEEGREREETDSIAEEDEYPEEPPSRCRSTLLINQTSAEGESIGFPGAPPYPLNVPQHLTRSASSLYSVPADWPLRRLAEGALWSANSVPDLTHTAMPHGTLPQQNQHHMPHYRGAANSPYFPNKAVNSPLTHTQTPPCTHYGQPQDSPFSHPLYTPPHAVPFSQLNGPYSHSHSIPCGPSVPYQSPYIPHPNQSAPYGTPFNLQGSPYNHYMPLSHPLSASNSLISPNVPYHPHMPYGQQYSGPFTPPPASFSCEASAPPPSMGTTEMQLRRVLHEIRGTVQSLNQVSSPDVTSFWHVELE